MKPEFFIHKGDLMNNAWKCSIIECHPMFTRREKRLVLPLRYTATQVTDVAYSVYYATTLQRTWYCPGIKILADRSFDPGYFTFT